MTIDLNGLALVFAIAVVALPDQAVAQSNEDRFELSVHVSTTLWSQFGRNDVGLGGRFAWHPVEPIGIVSEITLYPRDFPDRVPFSRDRVEGLFGVTVGPRFGRLRPFARLRSGFLNVREAPQPIACILIFPPPLSCQLASGRTLLALDIGGGVEVFATHRTFVRIDAGDRLLKYPGPVFDGNFTRRDADFFSHDFRFAAGAGLRF
jgi:hypothetical protein